MKELSTDQVFDAIGHLGRGQMLYMAGISSLSIFLAFHMVLNIFTGLEPEFYCLPLAINASSETEPSRVLASHLPDIVDALDNSSIRNLKSERPSQLIRDVRSLVTGLHPHSFNSNKSSSAGRPISPTPVISSAPHNSSRDGFEPGGTATTTASHLRNECPANDAVNCRIIYDPGYKSFVQEWGLVCNQQYRVAVVQSVWMAGTLAGALLLAGLTDTYGRSSMVLISILGTVAFEGLASFAEHYAIFVLLRFLGGMMCSVVILGSFVLCQEVVGSSKRSLTGVLTSVSFSFGISLLAAIAAHTDHWRTLMLLTSVAGVPMLLIMFCIPESPRWLLSKGRTDEAQAVLVSIGRLNGRQHSLPQQWRLVVDYSEEVSPVDIDSPEFDQPATTITTSGGGADRWLDKKMRQTKNKKLSKVLKRLDEKSTGFMDLMHHGYIVQIFLVQIYSWFVNSSVYYGLTLASGSLGGSAYTSTALNGLAEIPGAVITFIIIDRAGRRFSLVLFMLCAGCSCLAMPLLASYTPAFTALALVGKLCISGSFMVAYIHSGEIMPTSLRNTCLGLMSVAARVGGIVCPFLLMLGQVMPNLQFAVLGLMALTSGLLNLRLPETLGRSMPDTVDDVLAFRTQQSKSWRPRQYRRLETAEPDEEVGESGDEEEDVLDLTSRGKLVKN